MEWIKENWKLLLPIVGTAITGILGGGTAGMIAFGVGSLALVFGGIWAINKYRQYKFKKAHEDGNQNAIEDQNKSIDDNQKDSSGDVSTFDQSKKDKENAKRPS